jgi:PAS domain S-box-containing protein
MTTPAEPPHSGANEASSAEGRTQQADADLARFFDLAVDLLSIGSPDGRIIRVNRSWEAVLGYTSAELCGRAFMDFVHPDDRQLTIDAIALNENSGTPISFVNRWIRKGGGVVWLEWVAAAPVGDRFYGVARDVTDRRRAEAELARLGRLHAALSQVNQAIARVRSRQELFDQVTRVIVEYGAFAMCWIGWLDPETRDVRVGSQFGDTTGYLDGIVVAADDRPEGQGPVGLAIRQGRPHVCVDFQSDPRLAPWRDRAARAGWRSSAALPIRLGGVVGGVLMVYGTESGVFGEREVALLEETALDVSFALDHLEEERHRQIAEARALTSERRFRTLVEHAPEAIFVHIERRFAYLNPAAAALFGATSAAELVGTSVMDRVPPEAFDAVLARTEVSLSRREAVPLLEHDYLRLDGTRLTVEVSAAPIVFEDQPAAVVFVRDVSERKRINSALLAGEAERQRLEAQLAQSQKMEAIGQLAGGVAHDFNNMLGVITGHAEMALMELPPGLPVRESLDQILAAGRRSAELTRQLLAFARRQPVQPRVLDLNETVEGLLKMLRRLIGEGMELRWLPGPGLWPVRLDPSQVDQVLANLVVNARDAMGEHGVLTIDTANVAVSVEDCARQVEFRPGEYVRIAVHDTGSGMSADVLAHVFEPFFTTKIQGRGTGLGLSTVYGIVKQNGGVITAESEPGTCTTFTIWFPRAPESGAAPGKAAAPALPRGTEVVLLVEDEGDILAVTRRMLERLGYQVATARTPAEAMRAVSESGGRIDLLVTDVIMPEMNGRELAAMIAERCGGIRRLYMSGYTADVIARHGVLDESTHFLQKPFSLAALAHAVRKALDAPL